MKDELEARESSGSSGRTKEDHGLGHVLILLFPSEGDPAIVYECTDREDLRPKHRKVNMENAQLVRQNLCGMTHPTRHRSQ